MSERVPSLWPAIMGYSIHRHAVPDFGLAVLWYIEHELTRVFFNINGRLISSPWYATGADRFECDEFCVEPFNFDEEAGQTWNFKWRDVEFRWYKNCGGYVSCNIELTPALAVKMLDACLFAMRTIEDEHFRRIGVVSPNHPRPTPPRET